MVLATEDFASTDGDAAALRPQLPAAERGAAAGRPLRAAHRPGRRPAPGAAVRRRRVRGWPPSSPTSTAHGDTRRADLEGQARAAHAASARSSCAATSSPRPRRSWSRSRCGRAPTSTRPPSSAASATSASCSCSTTRRRSPFRGKGQAGAVGRRWWSSVEERYEQYSVVHVGRRRLDRPEAARLVVPGRRLRPRRLRQPQPAGARGWTPDQRAHLRHRDAARQRRRSWTAASWGRCSGFDASFTYLQQATVRLGDIHSGGGSIGFSREMYPGVDAGLHYNLRNTTHTEPLIRAGRPRRDARTTSRLGTTVGSMSAPTSSGCAWTTAWCRRAASGSTRSPSWRCPRCSVPLRPFPFAIGDDRFLKVGRPLAVGDPARQALFLRHGFRYDQGFPLGGASLLPKVERYFAGGDTTIRGYQLDRARVEVVDSRWRPSIRATRRPASIWSSTGRSAATCASCRTSTCSSRSAPPWYGAVFMDNGVVADSLDGLGLAQFRHGIGVSPLLIRLPIGDVSLAWAWPLDPGPGDTASASARQRRPDVLRPMFNSRRAPGAPDPRRASGSAASPACGRGAELIQESVPRPRAGEVGTGRCRERVRPLPPSKSV